MRKFLLLLGLICIQTLSFGQLNQLEENQTLFKPRITPGVGILTFYGDVGQNNKNFSILNGRPAADLRLSLPITEAFDIHFDAMFGRLAVNEQFSNRQLNFISDIKVFSFHVSYNFHHFRSENSKVFPYISVGATAFDFLTRVDLKDNQGNPYFNWTDGTIRSLPQNSVNAGSAEILMRNYNFETGVRDLDLDGFGLYNQNSYAIPVGIGAEMELTPHVNFKIGSTFYFTFTDLIDNVTANSVANRQGNSRNDYFLYTNLGLSFNLNGKTTDEKPKIIGPTIGEKNELFALLVADSDGDGIRDFFDECPNTPAGVLVDEKGCPLDTDGDGVPDYRDLEPNTRLGAFVNRDGVTLTDEDFLKRFRIFKDSTGEFTAQVISTVYEGKSVRRPEIKQTQRPTRTFAVKMSESTTGVSQSQVDLLLSIPDVKTVQQGDTTFYLVGDYDNLPEAIKRQLDLEQRGVAGSVVAKENEKISSINEGERKEAAKTIAQEKQTQTQTIQEIAASSAQTVYRVQLGAFRFNVSKNVFADVDDLVVIKGEDGLTRYSSGAFTDLTKAIAHKTNMLTKGYEGAFVAAYRDGKRIKLSDAGGTYTRPDVVETSNTEATPNAISIEGMKFMVQLGAFRERVPTEILNSYISLGKVSPKRDQTAGLTKYTYGTYKTYQEAQNALREVRARGFETAFIVAELNNKMISAKDALNLLGLEP
ncbi:MAG: hypothetical protein ACXITV_01860 [Luteibaculaceae bacterium]